ncbi:MAG: hypothetical protein IJU23_12710 [Proteobacteria bacterium]|nr:hypothetical protein [Pseudomonadota bacterium]
MTEEEMKEKIERINNFWKLPRPKAEGAEEKKKLVPIHDFDNLEFTSDEHVKAVREYYEARDRKDG